MERLLDDGEPLVLGKDMIDLRVLVVEGDREVDRHRPDGVVLKPS
jgi:hypothetical protein